MVQATIREELTPDDIDKLARHAGRLSEDIGITRTARKEAMRIASERIREMEAELEDILRQLRRGYRELPAQTDMFGAGNEADDLHDRLEETRAVVRAASGSLKKDAEYAELLEKAAAMARGGRVTTSILRRGLRIGKAKAERIMRDLADRGVDL